MRRTGSTATGDCGYQDMECWVRQLRAAGWLPVSARTGAELPGSTLWRSPDGGIYRGPFGAWKVMAAAREGAE